MMFPRLPLDDEIAIRSLFARYGHLADSGDPAFADMFTEDATWTRANSPSSALGGSGLPAETVRGRDALRQLMVEVMQKKFKGLVHHQMTDFYVEPGDGPDQAAGWSRALITDWRDGPGKVAMFATYETRFARTADGWLISSMTLSVLPKKGPGG